MWKNTYAVIVALAFYFIACSDENPAIPSVECSSSKYFSSSVLELESSSSSVFEECSSSTMNVESSSSNVIVSSSSEFSSSSLEQSSSSIYVSHGLMTDERDGQVYKTVTIGNQTWMAQNLNYAYTQPINDLDSGSWCYNNDPENCTKYGRLYTWAAAMDSIAYFKEENDNCLKSCTHDCEKCGQGVNWQIGFYFRKFEGFNLTGVCPENWHIPSVNEWKALLDLVNTIDLKSTSGWIDDGNGTDKFGFSVFPAEIIGEIACFWTPVQITYRLDEFQTISDFENAFAFCFLNDNNSAMYEDFDKNTAKSIRCVKGSSNSEEYLESISP